MTGLRVAHVIHHLGAGGTERRLVNLIADLDRERYEPLLVCIDGLGPLTEDVRSLGIEPVVLGRVRRFDATGMWQLARLLRAERVAVVHGWLSLASTFAAVAGTLARGTVRVAGEGGSITTMNRGRARRDAVIGRVLAPLTDAYVANSETVAEALREKGLPAEKITVIPNGVGLPEPLDEQERIRLRAELGVSPDEQLIGMIARLDPGFKDHETFLASVALLVAEGRPVRAAVVGDGVAKAGLERRARELGLADRVVFTGYRSDARRLVGAFDVSLLLTFAEGFSNALLETMAAAVPLVATAIPSNVEAIEDGVQGLLVPVRDLPQTATALRRLLDDGTLGRRLGEAANRRATERYSRDAQARRTMELYDRLLATRAV